MRQLDLPVSVTKRELRPSPEPLGRRPRILVTGSAGVVATILARDLSGDHDLVALDVQPVREPAHWSETIEASVGERDTVLKYAAEADYVLHMAHGSSGGWAGLREVDIDGTLHVLDGAVRGPCRRVVIASSNHVTGWSELDYLAGMPVELPLDPSAPLRPDGLYGVAKVTGEALARAAAEFSGLPVSVLRIGTVRLNDDVEEAAAEEGFAYIGNREAVRRRLSRTWLSHGDLIRYVREEFTVPETFRLRYAASSEQFWSAHALNWTAPHRASGSDDNSR